MITFLGVGITGESAAQRYLRLDMDGTNSPTFTALGAPTFTTQADATAVATLAIVAGGVGADFAIIEITESGGAGAGDFVATDEVTVDVASVSVTNTTNDITVNSGTYADLSSAASESGPLATDSGPMISFAASGTLLFAVNPSPEEATIASDFQLFEDTCPGADCSDADAFNMGTFTLVGAAPVTQPAGTRDRTGFIVLGSDTAAQIIPGTGISDLVGALSTITISGSFDTATAVELADGGDCSARVAPGATYSSTIAADLQSVQFVFLTDAGVQIIDDASPCYIVSGTTTVVATPAYTATTSGGTILVGVDGTLADATGPLSGLSREGSTAQIPRLTTFVDYNQRVQVTNRGPLDAAYTITFTTEAGATAVAGPAATGIIPAGEVLVLRASDIALPLQARRVVRRL